jgi:hypothetical protein
MKEFMGRGKRMGSDKFGGIPRIFCRERFWRRGRKTMRQGDYRRVATFDDGPG